MSFKKRSKGGLLKQAIDFRVPEGVTPSAAYKLLESLDCPRSLAVWIILKNDPLQLKTLVVNPTDYNSFVDFRDAYLATKLLWKANFLETGVSTEEVAFKKFFEMEDLCRQTNFRFDHPLSDRSYSGPNVWLLNATRRKIESVLVGYSPEEFFGLANWGPGVTTRITGFVATASNKFQCETGITRDLYHLVSRCLKAAYPIWGSHLKNIGFPEFDIGNKVITVPKDAFTDRVIAVEPGLNLWFQKAVGTMIRRRLLVHGIDLNSQERNQQLARKGSHDSSLATVDFSSASDSISSAVVRELIPSHWHMLMDACRSHYGIIDSKPVKWNKFSSMGNGFTFELESLIFYAAAFAVCQYLKVDADEISVYGDDVVLPVAAFDLFSSFSEFLGFSVNRSKSYSSETCFRESCGAHWYDGADVKPIFIKKVARDLFELYRQLNSIRWLAHLRCNNLACDELLKPAWLSLFRFVPRNLRIFGTYGKGDGFIIGNFDEASPVAAYNKPKTLFVEGYKCRQFIHVGVTRRSEEVGLFLDRLRNPSVQEYGNNYTLRGRTRTRLSWVLVPQWYDLGPWL